MDEEQFQNQPTEQQQKSGGFTFQRIGKYLLLGGCAFLLYIFLAPLIDPPRRSGRLPSLNNLKNIALAMHNHASQNNDKLPPGATVDASGKQLHSWMTVLLALMDQPYLDRKIDHAIPWDAPANSKHFQTAVQVYLNPNVDETETATGYAMGHYSVNKNLFYDNSEVRLEGIVQGDGVGQTLLAGEINKNLPAWGDPSNRRDFAIGLNSSPHGFGSPSVGIVNVVFADGRAKSLSENIDPEVLKALSTPNGGEEIDPAKF